MPQIDRPEYSVVVPVLNEAGNIEPLIAEIVTAMDSLDGSPRYEIIYIDDGSTDATADELRASTPKWTCLRTLRHTETSGQSQALISGVSHASGTWVITLDGDGQNDPADISKLLAARDNAKVSDPEYAECFLFVGHRLLRNDSLARKYLSWLANDIRGWLLGDHMPDSGCGLKLFRRDLFNELPRFDALHRFLPALVIRAGGRVISVEVSHRPRVQGRSKYGFWRRLSLSVVDLLGVMWLIARQTRPNIVKEEDEI